MLSCTTKNSVIVSNTRTQNTNVKFCVLILWEQGNQIEVFFSRIK